MVKILKITVIVICIFCSTKSNAQLVGVATNPTHTALVIQNSTRRMLSEQFQQKYAEDIKTNLDEINKNLAKVVFVKNQIYNSLVNVNEALKDGKVVLQMANDISAISQESTQLLVLAKDNPQFALFAEKKSKEAVGQALGVYNDVNTYILGDSKDLLMDYNARDELLIKVSQRLKLLRASLSSARRSMQWAIKAGLWQSLNPFQSWINQDKIIVEDIMRKYNGL